MKTTIDSIRRFGIRFPSFRFFLPSPGPWFQVSEPPRSAGAVILCTFDEENMFLYFHVSLLALVGRRGAGGKGHRACDATTVSVPTSNGNERGKA